ncbi:uncharacterized protein LOC142342497 [Convolutriloba macropyga]|uniref:uncharacterized protein LOC142342497 n=1 Tax=Convolutriloba macropyga TaxID=536237 RepID=UPI003F5246D6
MASSFIILQCVLVVSSVTMFVCRAECPESGDWERIPDTPKYFCYALLNISEGVISYWDASDKCLGMSSSIAVIVDTRAELNAVREWALSRGLPGNGESGFWTGFVRTVSAPENQQGILSSRNKAIRQNRTLFENDFGQIVPDELWRNESQPGDKLDKRDELCTAQSYPGRPEFLGIDDYSCHEHKLHYGICRYEIPG